jgi:hypothetical protein
MVYASFRANSGFSYRNGLKTPPGGVYTVRANAFLNMGVESR